MLFGLFNALFSFEGYISKILVKKLNIFVIVDLDSIFIYILNLSQAHINAI